MKMILSWWSSLTIHLLLVVPSPTSGYRRRYKSYDEPSDGQKVMMNVMEGINQLTMRLIGMYNAFCRNVFSMEKSSPKSSILGYFSITFYKNSPLMRML